MTSIYSIVPFQSLHLEPASLLHQECFEGFWPQTTLAETMAEAFVMGFSAILKDKPQIPETLIGFIVMRTVLDEAEILTLVVSPHFRSIGAGKALLSRAMATAYKRGCEHIFLEAAADNKAALKLYSLFGAKKCGERAGYYLSNKGYPKAAILLEIGKK